MKKFSPSFLTRSTGNYYKSTMLSNITRIGILLRNKTTIAHGLRLKTLLNLNFQHSKDVEVFKIQRRNVSTARQVNKQEEFNPAKWFMLLIPVTAFGLGTWQVQRRGWKKKLIADLKTRTSAEPQELPENLDELEDLEYYPVRVRGEFDHSRELYMGPRSLIVDGDAASQGGSFTQMHGSQSGYLVITPFHVADRDMTILINRGWVPARNKDPRTRKEGQIDGEVEMVGVVRLEEKRAPFMPQNKGSAWFYRDLSKMAEVAGAVPVYLEATADYTVSGGPVGGQTRITLRDEHLSYLLTWYGLSAATAVMWYRVFVARKPLW